MTQTAIPTINDGFYMVILDNRDFIFRIKTHDEYDQKYPGKQVVAKVRKFGSCTMHNIGWLDEGQLKRTGLRWTNPEYDAAVINAVTLLLEGDEAVREAAGKLYARSFGHCYVCNRELTHPDSRDTGIGPECSSRRKHLELWDEDHEEQGQAAEAAHKAAVRKSREKKLIWDDELEGQALRDTIYKRGRPIVLQYKKESWQLEEYESSYPGVKQCIQQIHDQQPPICCEQAVWRTLERATGMSGYCIGYYCKDHLPPHLDARLKDGDFDVNVPDE